MDTRNQGFTLIEILIVVVILGIIVSLAVPSYAKFIAKSKRGDAIASLQELAGEQEQFHSAHNRFASTMLELGYDAATTPSNDGHYIVSVQSASGTGFVLAAVPQHSDAECGTLALSSDGLKTASGSMGLQCW